ncbi:MAG TPA: septal ring lytic transglycosylase RlpA family protein, partial [Casimicrobiaceae bacterium]
MRNVFVFVKPGLFEASNRFISPSTGIRMNLSTLRAAATAAALGLAASFAVAQTTPPAATAPAPAVAPTPPPAAAPATAAVTASAGVESGKIAWYGRKFAGRRTASGEHFNPDALTMAHKTLPFGTLVKITNPANKKSVTV